MSEKESKNAFPVVVDEYDKITQETVDHFKPLVKRWKARDVGDFQSWLSLLKQIMKVLESKASHEGGIAKATLAIDIIQKLAQMFIDENIANLNEDQMKTVNLILSDEGAAMLRVSTGLLKRLLNAIDTNNDGNISTTEAQSFFKKIFCFCCKNN